MITSMLEYLLVRSGKYLPAHSHREEARIGSKLAWDVGEFAYEITY